MKFRQANFDEARAEAHRLALAYIANENARGTRWQRGCGEPEPDVSAPGFDRRKPITRWVVRVWTIDIDGGDGDLSIDTETKQVEWKPWW